MENVAMNNVADVADIVVHAQEVKKDKQTFLRFSAEIGDIWYKIKFNKTCTDIPKERGIYDVSIDLAYCSIQPGKPYIKKDGTEDIENDTIWVEKILGIHKRTEEELRAANRMAMNKIFGR